MNWVFNNLGFQFSFLLKEKKKKGFSIKVITIFFSKPKCSVAGFNGGKQTHKDVKGYCGQRLFNVVLVLTYAPYKFNDIVKKNEK